MVAMAYAAATTAKDATRVNLECVDRRQVANEPAAFTKWVAEN